MARKVPVARKVMVVDNTKACTGCPVFSLCLAEDPPYISQCRQCGNLYLTATGRRIPFNERGELPSLAPRGCTSLNSDRWLEQSVLYERTRHTARYTVSHAPHDRAPIAPDFKTTATRMHLKYVCDNRECGMTEYHEIVKRIWPQSDTDLQIGVVLVGGKEIFHV